MSQSQHPRSVRLGVHYEASALIASLGPAAYSAACARAAEASSDAIAEDWSAVAHAIARRSRRRRGGLFAVMFHEARAGGASAAHSSGSVSKRKG